MGWTLPGGLWRIISKIRFSLLCWIVFLTRLYPTFAFLMANKNHFNTKCKHPFVFWKHPVFYVMQQVKLKFICYITISKLKNFSWNSTCFIISSWVNTMPSGITIHLSSTSLILWIRADITPSNSFNGLSTPSTYASYSTPSGAITPSTYP